MDLLLTHGVIQGRQPAVCPQRGLYALVERSGYSLIRTIVPLVDGMPSLFGSPICLSTGREDLMARILIQSSLSFFRHEGLYEEPRREPAFRSARRLRRTVDFFRSRRTVSVVTARAQTRPVFLWHDDVDFSRVLDALVTRGFVVKYRVDGVDYGCIPYTSPNIR